MVRALDDTARTFCEIVDLNGVQLARRWSWERAAAVRSDSRVHGTVRSQYRFVRHPFVFLGSGGAETEVELARNAGLRYTKHRRASFFTLENLMCFLILIVFGLQSACGARV